MARANNLNSNWRQPQIKVTEARFLKMRDPSEKCDCNSAHYCDKHKKGHMKSLRGNPRTDLLK